ncbi:MAG: BMP family ABC transporter substrate-binding protein [Spirochaetes bacterium]|nr:BMP family ABC transporter substrate-binding protein [Spirochaetota bacterium]
MKKTILFLMVAAVSLAVVAPLFATGKGETGPVKIGVFVPGVAAGSPLYEQLVSGANKVAAENPNLSIKVVEAGFNQAEWPEKMTALAATGEYTWILTSNPSMPDVCKDIFKAFPKQKFIFMDGYVAGNPMTYSVMYNQVEQGYMAGYLAGLVTKSTMKGATPDLKVGAIVAQEYPALTKEMIPGYTQGFKAVDPGITLDYRVIGNWYDANKAADLANSMMDAGVDVILSIAGGAGQGTIKAAQARGRYIVYFDSNVYSLAPGTIIGCATLDQERIVVETLKKALQGKLAFGKADVVNAKAGYVDFADKDPLYLNNVAADIVAKMADLMKKFRGGSLSLPVPQM